jgi:hypothetical protein
MNQISPSVFSSVNRALVVEHFIFLTIFCLNDFLIGLEYKYDLRTYRTTQNRQYNSLNAAGS